MEVIDQAQHFAALGPVGSSTQSGDMAQSFREGLDATERECEKSICLKLMLYSYLAVFSLAQESAKRTKQWYESTDRSRR